MIIGSITHVGPGSHVPDHRITKNIITTGKVTGGTGNSGCVAHIFNTYQYIGIAGGGRLIHGKLYISVEDGRAFRDVYTGIAHTYYLDAGTIVGEFEVRTSQVHATVGNIFLGIIIIGHNVKTGLYG